MRLDVNEAEALIEELVCPRRAPVMDKRRWTTPTILKTLGVDGFDHSAS
jgi:hypothetical protein